MTVDDWLQLMLDAESKFGQAPVVGSFYKWVKQPKNLSLVFKEPLIFETFCNQNIFLRFLARKGNKRNSCPTTVSHKTTSTSFVKLSSQVCPQTCMLKWCHAQDSLAQNISQKVGRGTRPDGRWWKILLLMIQKSGEKTTRDVTETL